MPFSSLSNLRIYMLDWNQFAEPNRHVYFSSSYFNLQVTCCALSGVALTIRMFFFLQCFEDPLHLQFHSFFLLNEKQWHENSSTGPLFYFKVKL